MSSTRTSHFPSLDGLRCFAFLLVFAVHSVPRTGFFNLPIQNGWVGVDVFFTLSGFLVTFVLLTEETRRRAAAVTSGTGVSGGGGAGFSLVRFWTRRSLRIWPLYLLLVGLCFFVFPRIAPWGDEPHYGTPLYDAFVERYGLASGTFLLNWAVLEHGWARGPIGPLWSVSIEEQFYVGWPLVLWFLSGRGRRVAAGVGIVVAFAVKAWLYVPHGYAPYLNSFARMDCFLAGALLALVVSSFREIPPPPKWIPWLAVALTPLVAWYEPIQERGRSSMLLGYALNDVWATALVWSCLTPGNCVSTIFKARPAQFLGRISYGLYCFHALALHVTEVAFEGLRNDARTSVYHLVRIPAAFALTLALALLSWHLWERWFLRWKDRFA